MSSKSINCVKQGLAQFDTESLQRLIKRIDDDEEMIYDGAIVEDIDGKPIG